MQPDQISINVDVANDDNIVQQTYNRVTSPGTSTSLYRMEGSDLVNKDELRFTGSLPKRNGNFQGVIRSGVRLSKDQEVPGVDTTTSIDSLVVMALDCSIPVGTPTATIVELRQRMHALIDSDAIMQPLNELAVI